MLRLNITVTQHQETPTGLPLLIWLNRDPVGNSVVFSPADGQHDPGSMGPALDLVQAVLGDVVQVGGLVVAVASWRTARAQLGGRQPRVEFEVDGVRVHLEGDDRQEVSRVAGRLTELLLEQDRRDHETLPPC